jgi:hypothetical protein
MQAAPGKLPPITIVVEWENALDVEDIWTHRAMQAFGAELERCRDRMSARPRIMYLYDRNRVSESLIRGTIDKVAPAIREVGDLELVPTPGLTYYKLKNHGVARTTTDLVIMLDSDAAPQPGWLPGVLAPFADPEVMAVGGFTVLGYNNLLSRVMALIWIFHLRSEREKTKGRKKINANNCAFRTAFFKANPWPDLPAFKKQCGFWLRDIEKRGIRWVRTVDAMTVHGPHPGIKFLTWRAWTAGLDRDFQACQTVTPTRVGRLGFALRFWLKKSMRATQRIVTKGHEVDLPPWQIPAALALAYFYHTVLLAGELWGALTRRYTVLTDLREVARELTPLPESHARRLRA